MEAINHNLQFVDARTAKIGNYLQALNALQDRDHNFAVGDMVMDSIVKFIQQENISRFLDQLCEEKNSKAQDLLRRLLIEEETKYGFYAEQLEIAGQQLVAAQNRIRRQKELIERLHADGQETDLAQNTLDKYIGIYNIFQSFQDQLSRSLNRNLV